MPAKLLTLIALSAILMAGSACGLRAQEEEEEVFIERPPYFGLGAGYMRVATLVDYEEMNKVSRSLGLGDFSGPFSMDFGGLMFTPGIVRNLRIGIYAGTGSTQLTRQIRLRGDTSYTRTIFFTSVVGTTQADYALSITSAFTVFPGLMLGVGRNTIGASQTPTGGTKFTDIFQGELFSGDTSASVSNLNRFARGLSYHIFVYPAVNFEYTLTPNVMLRVGAGYNTSLRITDWTDEGGVTLTDDPEINTNGVSFQAGLFLGLFQH